MTPLPFDPFGDRHPILTLVAYAPERFPWALEFDRLKACMGTASLETEKDLPFIVLP